MRSRQLVFLESQRGGHTGLAERASTVHPRTPIINIMSGY
jgi:hypothetical protein